MQTISERAGLRARPFRRPAALAAVLGIAALAATGCGGGDDSAASDSAASNMEAAPAAREASTADVTIKAFIFKPKPLEVAAGAKVSWENQDSTVHTVTSGPRDMPDGRFDERLEESGGRFETTFEEPGTYEYYCTIHSGPGMEGSVIVR